jgi:hypothetical protein
MCSAFYTVSILPIAIQWASGNAAMCGIAIVELSQ